MKRLVLSLVLLATAAGCNLLTDDDSSAADTAERYLPLKTGVTWVYTVTENDTVTYTETDRIAGTTVSLLKTYWLVEASSPAWTEADTTLIRLSGSTLYMQPSAIDAVTKPAGTAKTALSLTGDLPYFEFGLATGATWSMFSATTSGDGVTIGGRYDGTESVTTPAGTFAECMKFACITTTVASAITLTKTETTWIAPNVGPVKRTVEETTLLGTYSSVSLLSSYSIP